MREIYGIKLAVFAAILQNASWPVQIFFYKEARKQHLLETKSERIITPAMYKSYGILGILSAFITLTRTMGITSLPASIYVICANTEIVFETIMTKVVLGREVSWMQLIAVGLVVSGVSISLYDPKNNRYGDGDGVSQTSLLLGVTVSLLSRFASSLNTILADRFLGKDAKSRMGVLECSLANSLIPCCVLPFVLLVVPEEKKWGDQLGGHAPIACFFIALLCLSVTVSKHADRLCKFSIVSMTSTMFFAAVDANMKVVAGIGSFLFFSDNVHWPQILGFVFIFFALIVMYLDKKHRTVAAMDKKVRMSMDVPATPSVVHNPLGLQDAESEETDDKNRDTASNAMEIEGKFSISPTRSTVGSAPARSFSIQRQKSQVSLATLSRTNTKLSFDRTNSFIERKLSVASFTTMLSPFVTEGLVIDEEGGEAELPILLEDLEGEDEQVFDMRFNHVN
jgi:drug/metabolite transporter (DMT)-like permease